MAQSIRGIIYLTVTRESRVNRDYVNYYFVFLSRDSVEKLGGRNSASPVSFETVYEIDQPDRDDTHTSKQRWGEF